MWRKSVCLLLTVTSFASLGCHAANPCMPLRSLTKERGFEWIAVDEDADSKTTKVLVVINLPVFLEDTLTLGDEVEKRISVTVSRLDRSGERITVGAANSSRLFLTFSFKVETELVKTLKLRFGCGVVVTEPYHCLWHESYNITLANFIDQAGVRPLGTRWGAEAWNHGGVLARNGQINISEQCAPCKNDSRVGDCKWRLFDEGFWPFGGF